MGRETSQSASRGARLITCALAAVIALVMVFALPAEKAQAATDYDPTYRLYNSYTGEHFYTTDANEYLVLVDAGWDAEGVAWYAPTSSETPVWRLYNSYTGEHLFTTDENEYEVLASIGWTQEGIAWYASDDESGVTVYRLYNPYEDAYTHLYTIDENEYAELAELGWIQEGVAWYAVDVSATSSLNDTLQQLFIYLSLSNSASDGSTSGDSSSSELSGLDASDLEVLSTLSSGDLSALSELSDEELAALMSSVDISSMSDEELATLLVMLNTAS